MAHSTPTNKQQAGGIEREELLKGPAAFGKNTLGGPAFGTINDPVLVYSTLGHRIVGCLGNDAKIHPCIDTLRIGGAETEHDLLWHNVKVNRPTVCIECGQFFMIQPVDEHGALVGSEGKDHSHHH